MAREKSPISSGTPPVEKAPNHNLRYQRDKDRELVRGIFRFLEVPGGGMSFVFKKYKEDPVERFDLIDGETYTIPLGVAKHLNNNCWYPEYDYISSDAIGSKEKIYGGINYDRHQARIARKVRRCMFQSLEFVDIEGFTPAADLARVEFVKPI